MDEPEEPLQQLGKGSKESCPLLLLKSLRSRGLMGGVNKFFISGIAAARYVVGQQAAWNSREKQCLGVINNFPETERHLRSGF
jgi:hypothetical protein